MLVNAAAAASVLVFRTWDDTRVVVCKWGFGCQVFFYCRRTTHQTHAAIWCHRCVRARCKKQQIHKILYLYVSAQCEQWVVHTMAWRTWSHSASDVSGNEMCAADALRSLLSQQLSIVSTSDREPCCITLGQQILENTTKKTWKKNRQYSLIMCACC